MHALTENDFQLGLASWLSSRRARGGLALLLIALAGCAHHAAASSARQAAAKTASETPPLPTTVFESSTALMPTAVTSFGAAELDGSVYAFGGYFGVPHAYNREGQSGELWRLDANAQTFERIVSSAPIQGAALVSTGGRLIRAGGMRADNAKSEQEAIHSLDEVASYTPGDQSWTALPPLPAPRSSHAAAVIGHTLYVVGGWQLGGNAKKGTFADSMFALDLEHGRYRKLPQPFKRRALAVAPLDGKLVALGGLDADAKFSREVQVFDPASGSWSRATDFPVDGFGIAATSTGDVLYASGVDGAVYALSEPKGSWSKVNQLAFPRFFHQLVIRGDQLLALGGISGMHTGPRIREVEVLPLVASGPRVLSYVLSNPLRGRNRQGVFVEGDSLYVFGGNRSLAQHDFAPEDFVDDAGRLDLAALSWSALPKFPVARQTMQTLVEGEHALVVGGFGHDGQEARAHADAFRYDLATDRWSSDPSVLPTPRTQFGLVAAKGARWVFGGLDFKPEATGEAQFDHPTSVLRAAPGEPFRDSGVRLPQPRRAFGGALLGDRYYMVGGMAAGFGSVATCDVYDFASSSWSQINCPKVRISPQLVALDGKLYLAGGSSAGPGGELAPDRSVEVFDPQTNSWSTLIAELPIEARHLSMLPYADGLLLYSAHDEQGRVHVAIIRP